MKVTVTYNANTLLSWLNYRRKSFLLFLNLRNPLNTSLCLTEISVSIYACEQLHNLSGSQIKPGSVCPSTHSRLHAVTHFDPSAEWEATTHHGALARVGSVSEWVSEFPWSWIPKCVEKAREGRQILKVEGMKEGRRKKKRKWGIEETYQDWRVRGIERRLYKKKTRQGGKEITWEKEEVYHTIFYFFVQCDFFMHSTNHKTLHYPYITTGFHKQVSSLQNP